MLIVCLRYQAPEEIQREIPASIDAFADHLKSLGILPEQIATAPRPLALVDLVSSGSTFRHVTALMLEVSNQRSVDLNAVRRRTQFVGITWRSKNSPNTFRWHQHASWLSKFSASAVKNVSIPGPMWDYLGNRQGKVVPTNPPWRWADSAITRPPRDSEHLLALRQALKLFDLGCTANERQSFSTELANQYAMRESWCRSLVAELRGKSTRG